MLIRLAGVRGSLPSPGPLTVRYGGNTTCVTVDIDPETVLILDAGTGIREVGSQLFRDPRRILILLTHVHWDHIQGFPFFKPAYLLNRWVRILVFEADWAEKLKATMDGSHYFPMKFESLRSDLRFVTENIEGLLAESGIALSHIKANHSGPCFGFRLERDGRSLVFLPDNELGATDSVTPFPAFVEFAKGADVLIHDSQYAASEMHIKRDWGHSAFEDTCRLAAEARVKQLVLFHHDPDRDDDAVTAMEKRAREILRGTGVVCRAAVEGDTFDLSAKPLD
jgi:phosphoribosyl 1,2-cyclic phosphodiesterase